MIAKLEIILMQKRAYFISAELFPDSSQNY